MPPKYFVHLYGIAEEGRTERGSRVQVTTSDGDVIYEVPYIQDDAELRHAESEGIGAAVEHAEKTRLKLEQGDVEVHKTDVLWPKLD